MDHSTTYLHALAEIYREPGPYSTVYLDLSRDTGNPHEVTEERRASVDDTLVKAGAPAADIAAIGEVLSDADGVADPVTVFGVVRDGEVVLSEVVRTTPVDLESISYGPLPDLTPAVKHALSAFPYLVVETSREGGEISLYRVGVSASAAQQSVSGDSDDIHKPKKGGGLWGDHIDRHVEEVWKRNQSELAAAVNAAVDRYRPRLVVVAGDIRARALLGDALSPAARAVLTTEPSDPVPFDASDARLAEWVDAEVERIVRDDEKSIADLIALHEGRGDNRAELTVGGIVHALESAQVDALLIDDAALGDRELLALDGAPWIATAPEDALTASIIAKVPARLALLRAALLTDARVYYTREAGLDDDPLTLPEGAAAAALLRWQTGPPVPGTES